MCRLTKALCKKTKSRLYIYSLIVKLRCQSTTTQHFRLKYLYCYLVNGLPVRVLEKAGLGFDFTKTQLTGTVSGFSKWLKTQISLANNLIYDSYCCY